MKFGYVTVEGPHDVEFIGRILSLYGLSFVENKTAVDPFWHILIPRSFPYNDILGKPVPVPAFYQSSSHSIAVFNAGGFYKLIKNLTESLSLVDSRLLTGIGIFADADNITPTKRFNELTSSLSSVGVLPPTSPGNILKNNFNIGIFIFPDNKKKGTLDDILILAGKKSYPKVIHWSVKALRQFHIKRFGLTKKELREFKKPCGLKKSILSLACGVLKPGKALQNTVRDNSWVCSATVEIPQLETISLFIKDLMDL